MKRPGARLMLGVALLSLAATLPAESQTGYYGESWALLVGINDYRHPRIPRLRFAVNDANAVERALLDQGFRPDRIVKLIDGQATRAAIEHALGDDLRSKVGPNDRLLVFFAGHGKTERLRSGEDEGYLLPVDGDPDRAFSTLISMDTLRKVSDRLPAKHILYVVDACYSGYAIYTRAVPDELLDEMVRKPAIQILTAGRQGDEAQERQGHGIFTDVFVRGIRGDAFPGKGWLSLEELAIWMKQRVFAESGKRQLPQYGSLSGEGQFVFLRPGATLAALPSAAPPALVPPRAEPPAPAGRGYRNDWTYSHPAPYTGRVWIRVASRPENVGLTHDYIIRWGPWRYAGSLKFEHENEEWYLVHSKGNDGLSIPIVFTISLPAVVTFGQGQPSGDRIKGVDRGWSRAE